MLDPIRCAAPLVALLLVVSAAVAQGRPDARAMSCQQTQSMLSGSGAAVLTTGQHTYDRYVRGTNQCAAGERAVRAYIATRDNASCLVMRCMQVDPEDDIIWPRYNR